jgi:hypothetical protein
MQTEDRRNGIGTITERAWVADRQVQLNGIDMQFARRNDTLGLPGREGGAF